MKQPEYYAFLIFFADKNRTKIIQTGLIPDVIYLAQDDGDDDSVDESFAEYDAEFENYRLRLRELLIMLDDHLPDK